MKNICLLLMSVLTLVSCRKEEQEKPKVSYDTPIKSSEKPVADTSKIAIADLPIQLVGTNVLIFPVGNVTAVKKSGYSRGEASPSYTVSNYGEYEITGYLSNLKFKEINKDTIYSLTDKPIVIQRATFLKEFADKTKQNLMLYVLSDLDTNKDSKLDDNDIKSLYISTVDGKNFKKLSPEFGELIDWVFIPSTSSVYFRIVEDSDKNGEFEPGDKIRYFTVNLLEKELKAEEYFPV